MDGLRVYSWGGRSGGGEGEKWGRKGGGGLTPPEVAAAGREEASTPEVGTAGSEEDSIIEARELLKEDPAESEADRVSEAGSEVVS